MNDTLQALEERAQQLAAKRAKAWQIYKETRVIPSLREYSKDALRRYEEYDRRHCKVIDAIIIETNKNNTKPA